MIEYRGITYQGKEPHFHERSYLAEGAVVKGDVRVDEYASIWHNVSIRGDINYVKVGRYTNIQDNAVLHVSDNNPCIVGDFVTVGHSAIVHACTIEDEVLIGIGAIVLDRSVIGHGSIIAAGALVPPGTVIPPYSLVVGVPGKVIRTNEEQVHNIHAQALKYKTMWTKWYGLLPDADGEEYGGEPIV